MKQDEISRLRTALSEIRTAAIRGAEDAGMQLMDGSITDLQRAVARGDIKRWLAIADIARTALGKIA